MRKLLRALRSHVVKLLYTPNTLHSIASILCCVVYCIWGRIWAAFGRKSAVIFCRISSNFGHEVRQESFKATIKRIRKLHIEFIQNNYYKTVQL